MRNLLLSAATVILAGAAFAASAQSARASQRGGSQHRSRPWRFRRPDELEAVADILTKKGYTVTLVENPLTSLAADVDATKHALEKQNGKTVLVGHSWGGVVITQAGGDPKVSALVYVSAFAPDVENLWRPSQRAGRQPKAAQPFIPTQRATSTSIPRCFRSAVAADLPPKIAETLANHQLPLNHAAFEAPVDTAAWHNKPTFYVITTKDKVIAPEAAEVLRRQDEGADDGGRRQPRLPRRPRQGSRRR